MKSDWDGSPENIVALAKETNELITEAEDKLKQAKHSWQELTRLLLRDNKRQHAEVIRLTEHLTKVLASVKAQAKGESDDD